VREGCRPRYPRQPVEKTLASNVRTSFSFFIFFSEYPEGKGDEEGEEELAATFFNSLLNTDT
jgi:hypothetical protein